MSDTRVARSRGRLGGILIVWEDRDILVIDKPAGLLTMSTAGAKDKTAVGMLTDYVRKGCAKSRNRVFVVHRLDRDTSGILVFAKSGDIKRTMQDHWQDNEKRYLAVVHGLFAESEGTITSYLAENQALVVYSTRDRANGKLSSTVYKVIKESGDFSLLDITLLTGRKNQIRVHLADRRHPVVGDSKYGRLNDGHAQLALHARSLSLNHPRSGRRVTFEAAVPPHFFKLVGPIAKIVN